MGSGANSNDLFESTTTTTSNTNFNTKGRILLTLPQRLRLAGFACLQNALVGGIVFGWASIDRTLFEDFTAVTLSGAWRSGRWTANARGEYRDGQFADREGLALGVIRQIGEGSSVGSNLIWTRSTAPGGISSEVIDAGITIAHRPDGSDFALLSRFGFRSDAVTGAVAGAISPVGRTALTVTGDALSRRLVGSVSANWSPSGNGAGQLSELGLFLGMNHDDGTCDVVCGAVEGVAGTIQTRRGKSSSSLSNSFEALNVLLLLSFIVFLGATLHFLLILLLLQR